MFRIKIVWTNEDNERHTIEKEVEEVFEALHLVDLLIDNALNSIELVLIKEIA